TRALTLQKGIANMQQEISNLQATKRLLKIVKQFQKASIKTESYNLFTVLRSKSDEVRLHSRFLTDLLNPKGQHGLGSFPIEAFFDTVLNLTFPMSSENTQVTSEYENIDVVITDAYKNSAVIIENKIYAEDQDQQLLRYFNTMCNEGYKNIEVVYLTLFGTPPSTKSVSGDLGTLKQKVVTISYREDILNWLSLLVEKSANNHALREALNQYSEILKELTNMNSNTQYLESLKELLIETDSVDLINDLVLAHNSLHEDVVHRFWNVLSEKMNVCFGGCDNATGSLSPIETLLDVPAFFISRGGNSELRITTPLHDYESCHLAVESNCQDVLFVGIKNAPNEKNDSLTNIAMNGYKKSQEWWPIYKIIRFENRSWHLRRLTSEQIMLLSNPAFVDRFTDHIIKELKNLAGEIKEQLTEV
ncbi:PD-(D/E)XK nuclease family protein, partial [Vibrio breoganii]